MEQRSPEGALRAARRETTVRMPLADIDRVRALLLETHRVSTVDGREVMRSLRLLMEMLAKASDAGEAMHGRGKRPM